MPQPIVRIGRAATGLGLFAAKPIARNSYIVTYRGRRIGTAEAQRQERRRGAKYMFEVNRRWTIDGSSRRNLGRYINHSCEPNAVAVLRKGRIVFVALRAIAPGEEITLDYGEEYFDLFIAASGCRCTACRRPPRGRGQDANGVAPLERHRHGLKNCLRARMACSRLARAVS